ncbi:AAC(3) family N-acetyltransferase [Martelella alba]|uniref:Aminoglycoside N(3)-acetyltransferase n=1 Tax=Martelella alba TaxID=2590451 RepID=A0A506U989_9HYPH|nr:AAC(3) family N-acetyltransferase [Martelella alba]TPW30098.1 AAC(3) family N-acetyltransferase [Martelella alba]
MSEAALVTRTAVPATRGSLGRELQRAGLEAASTVIVHTSLKALGWIAGGPVALIEALIDVVGDNGTIIMPAHSPQMTDPANWQHPAVPQAWHAVIEAEMPAFDPATTPSRGMGQTAELFRTWPGTLRSNHPMTSFAARGERAAALMRRHDLESPLGEGSPLAELYHEGAVVLLLGVGFDRCTMMHLAEDHAFPRRPKMRQASAVTENGQRVWKRYSISENMNSERFVAVGADLVADGTARRFAIGAGYGIIVPARAAVDRAAAAWRATDWAQG